MFCKDRLTDYQPNIVGSLVLVTIWAVTCGFMLFAMRRIPSTGESEPAYLLATTIGTAIFLAGYCHVTGRAVADLFHPSTARQPTKLRQLVIPIILVSATLYLVEIMYLFRFALFGPDAVGGIVISGSTLSLTVTLLTLLSLCVATPLIEELLFRGIVLRGLLQRNPAWLAIALSSLLFGVLHIGPSSALMSIVSGLLFGWLYWRSRSLLPSILAHAAINFINWAFFQFPFAIQTLPYVVVTIAAVPIGLIALFRIHRMTGSEDAD